MQVIGVDEHVCRHTRRGDKYVTVIIDLTGSAMAQGRPGRRWQEEFPLEVERARRSRAGLAVALIDLDRFKRLNDTTGDGAGDQLLQAVTSVPPGLRRLSQARPSLSLPSSRAKSP